MKLFFFLSLAMLVSAIVAQIGEPLFGQPAVFFDQCSCDESSFQFIQEGILLNSLVLEGSDRFSCRAPNNFTEISEKPGLVYESNFAKGEGGLTSQIDTSFFRNEAGEKKNFFVRIGFEVPEDVVDFSDVFMLKIPEENIDFGLAINPRNSANSDRQVALFAFNAISFAFVEFEGGAELEATLFVQKVQTDGPDEPPNEEATLCISGPVVRNGATCSVTSFRAIEQPEFRDFNEPTSISLFENTPLDLDVNATIIPTFVEFGGDFFNEEELEALSLVRPEQGFGPFNNIAESKILNTSKPFIPALPVVLTDEIILSSLDNVTLNLSQLLFEEPLEGINFFVENIENLKGVVCSDSLCDNPEIIPYSPPQNNFEESFIVSISAEGLSCGFDLNVTIKVIEEEAEKVEDDATGAIVGATIGAIFFITTIVAGVVFMTQMKKKQAEESAEEKAGATVINPETDI